jgi:hypothetical protein
MTEASRVMPVHAPMNQFELSGGELVVGGHCLVRLALLNSALPCRRQSSFTTQ